MIRYLTAGESHGKAIVCIGDGFPAGLKITEDDINEDLARRRDSIGRGGRSNIEPDMAQIISGVRNGKTIGSPVTVLIENKDWENWKDIMAVDPPDATQAQKKLTRPRPGHADLPGIMKFGFEDIRNVLERASARETAGRVAVGRIARNMLGELGVKIGSFVKSIGSVESTLSEFPEFEELKKINPMTRCLDEKAGREMTKAVEEAAAAGDSLGGTFCVAVYNAVPGIGSYAQWDKKLDANLAQAIMSIPAIKAVEIGEGFSLAGKSGSQAADEILFEKQKGFYRKTDKMGGIEGGMTNGETVIINAAMKPIPTIKKGLGTVDIGSFEPQTAHYERSDVCAVPRAAVIGEAVVMLALANAIAEKFGGDSMDDLKKNYYSYKDRIKWSSSH